jgi:hypothetical protein
MGTFFEGRVQENISIHGNESLIDISENFFMNAANRNSVSLLSTMEIPDQARPNVIL